MVKTVLNIKTDPEVKKEAQKVARELGVPLSIVVNAYLKEFIREKEMCLRAAPCMSPRLEKLLVRVEEDIQKKKNLSPAFTSVTEMREYLDALR
ncbi:MAG: hypothetical protein AAB539_01490 [Patescibacteria group bacterium]